ncbi:hypothetical protein SDJN03_19652, partial [Cucurbita argyrosperma subsp. sororia]
MGPLFDSVMQSWNFLKISVLRFDPSSSPRSDRSCSGLMSWENHEVNWEFHVTVASDEAIPAPYFFLSLGRLKLIVTNLD